MKSWKKQLNRELDRIVPPVCEKGTEKSKENSIRRSFNRRKLAAILSAAASFVLICAIVLTSVVVPASKRLQCITLEINPAAVFTVSGGKVKNVAALNEDADVVLSDKEFLSSLIQTPAEKAVALYTDRAARLGFLDLNGRTAVRLGGAEEDEKLLKSAQNGLETYFREQGAYVAVAKRIFTEEELLTLFGAETGNPAKTANGLATLYTARMAATMTEAELKQNYEDRYIYGGLKQAVEYAVQSSLAVIERAVALLDEMEAQNALIEESDDNPAIFLDSYWSVRELYSPEKYTSEFAALMERMDALVAEYASLGIGEIDSATALAHARTGLTRLPLSLLKDFAEGIADRDLDLYGNSLLDLLENVGFDSALFRTLLDIPKTVSEYVETVTNSCLVYARERLEHFAGSYGAAREALSEADYAAFLGQIGTAEELWDSLHA